MSGQHQAVAASMLHFLALAADARAWLITGLHTGRANVASFLETGKEAGLEVEVAWERDVEGMNGVGQADKKLSMTMLWKGRNGSSSLSCGEPTSYLLIIHIHNIHNAHNQSPCCLLKQTL